MSIPSSCLSESVGAANQSKMAIQDFCRFIERPAEDEVAPSHILKPHLDRTLQRLRLQEVTLAIMDESTLNFNTGAESLAVHLHLALAITPEGLPLGMLNCGFHSPAQEKKTQRWLRGLDEMEEASQGVSRKSQIIAVMDLEADFYKLFAQQRAYQGTEILVCVRPHRKFHKEQQNQLFSSVMAQEPEVAEVSITIEASSLKKKTSQPGGKKRIATCEIRFGELCLESSHPRQEPLVLWGISIEEKNPQEGLRPVSWKFLTSIKIKDKNSALKLLEYYQQRAKIEEFFRVLKAGCKIEKIAFSDREDTERMVSILSVMAWRIIVMCLLGSEAPKLDPKIMFSDDELGFLKIYATKYKKDPPHILRKAVDLVSLLGGYYDRESDPDPESKFIWYGSERLYASAMTYSIVQKQYENNLE